MDIIGLKRRFQWHKRRETRWKVQYFAPLSKMRVFNDRQEAIDYVAELKKDQPESIVSFSTIHYQGIIFTDPKQLYKRNGGNQNE